MTLKIIQGGWIRYPFDVTADDTWNAGNVLQLSNSTSKLTSSLTTTANRLFGLVIENKNTTTDQTAGSGKASLLLDEAYVQSNQLRSGSAFSPGSRVYFDTSGNLCTSANAVTDGAGTALMIGIATNSAQGNSGDTLEFFYSVQI